MVQLRARKPRVSGGSPADRVGSNSLARTHCPVCVFAACAFNIATTGGLMRAQSHSRLDGVVESSSASWLPSPQQHFPA